MNHAHRSQLRDQENPNPKEPQMLLVTHDVPAEDSGSDTSAPPKTDRRETAATNYTAFFQGSGESSDNCDKLMKTTIYDQTNTHKWKNKVHADFYLRLSWNILKAVGQPPYRPSTAHDTNLSQLL